MTQFTRRDISKALLAAGTFAAAPWAAAQDAFPSKPVKIVVPTPPGGNLDLVARIIAERLQTAWGQGVIVENRTGASSSIGTRFVGTSPADGYTLLMIGNTFASTPGIMPSAGYDAIKDFVGVSYVVRLPEVFIVPNNSPYKTLQELVAAAKSKPGAVTYASAGSGSVSRFASERMAKAIGAKMTNVPYKGNGEALIDMVAGRVDSMFDQLSTSLPYVKQGRLRALAITADKRSELLPDVPTFGEAGVKDMEDWTWNGLVAPAATPKDVVAKIHATVLKVLQMPEVRTRFASQGLEVRGGETPEQFTAFIRSEVTRLAKLAQEANIKLE